MNELLGYSKMSAILSNDIAELVDMFCLLFGLNQAGIRLTVLNSAMCPKFHVDRVPCRLITTYHGIATEWLPHGLANRTKLGHGSQGKEIQAPHAKNAPFEYISNVEDVN